MRGLIDNREHLVAYLLGELPAAAEAVIEQDYLADDQSYQELLVVEDELAYDYLNGHLSPQRRQRFESTIGATERGRGNLEFARSLLAAMQPSRRPAERSTPYWTIGIAAMLILSALPAWLAFRVVGLTREIERLRAASAQAVKTSPPPAPVEAALLLTPGRTRGAEGPARIDVAPQADIIRFELVLPPGVAGGDCVVAIRSDGAEVWSRSVVMSGRTLVAAVPTRLFHDGEYEIAVRRLTAGEQAADLATYSFRLSRR